MHLFRIKLRYWFAVLFLAPLAASFVPGWPVHGFGHVWYLLWPLFWFREPAQRRRLLWYAAALGLQVLAYPDVDLGFLGWVLLLPYLVGREADDGASWWRAAWLYGFLRAHVGYYWLGNIHFAAWFGVSLGSGFLFMFVFEQVLRRARFLPYALRVATAWVLFEWTHSWFLGGFPWLFLAHTQYRYLPVVQAADVLGAFGISFLLAYAQAAALRVRVRRTEGIVAAGLVVAALAYGFLRDGPDGDGPKVLMVQTDIPHAVKERQLMTRDDMWQLLMKLTREGLREHPDTRLVVWPETMHPWGYIEDQPIDTTIGPAARVFAQTFKLPAIVGLNSATTRERAMRWRTHNSAALFDARGEFKGLYRKQRLVPMGEEFLPRRLFPEKWCDAWFGWLVDNIGYPRSCDLVAGEGFTALDAGPGLRCAVLICFEGLYAADCRDATRFLDVDLLLHLVNNGWFGDSWEQRQCVASWVFRAVETRTPFLSCANAGITCAVAPSGEVVARLDKVFETGHLGVAVPPRWAESVFSKGGYWLLPAALALAAAICLYRVRRRAGTGR